MADNKTQETRASVEAFLAAIDDPARQQDCRTIAALMAHATDAEARMWGAGIVGFGRYHYRYESGREGDSAVLGFSPRKGDLTLYFACGFGRMEGLLARLGKHRLGKGCLYLKKLADVDPAVLGEMCDEGVRAMQGKRVDG